MTAKKYYVVARQMKDPETGKLFEYADRMAFPAEMEFAMFRHKLADFFAFEEGINYYPKYISIYIGELEGTNAEGREHTKIGELLDTLEIPDPRIEPLDF